MNIQWLWPLVTLLSLNEHSDIFECKTVRNNFVFSDILIFFGVQLRRYTSCACLPYVGENCHIGHSALHSLPLLFLAIKFIRTLSDASLSHFRANG